MQTKRDVMGLTEALGHADAQIRRRAAAALRVVGLPQAVPHLRRALDKEQDTQARLAIVAALEYLGEPAETPQEPAAKTADAPDAPMPIQSAQHPKKHQSDTQEREAALQTRFERLLQHLMGTRPHLAIQAAEALGEMQNPRAVTPLIQTFQNPRKPAALRLAAARSLLELDSAPPSVTLLGALRSEKWHLRRNGAAILGRMQADWAVEPLKDALQDSNELVARTAQAALKNIDTPEARQALEENEFIPQTAELPKRDPRPHQRDEQDKLSDHPTLRVGSEEMRAFLRQYRKPEPTSEPEPTPKEHPSATQQAETAKPAQSPTEPETQPEPKPPRIPSRRRKSAQRRLSNTDATEKTSDQDVSTE